MSDMTYTRCPMCGGTEVFLTTDGERPCPCMLSDHPGWAPTGLTLSQIERMAELERALAGDPGVTEGRRRQLLLQLRTRVRAALALLEADA